MYQLISNKTGCLLVMTCALDVLTHSGGNGARNIKVA